MTEAAEAAEVEQDERDEQIVSLALQGWGLTQITDATGVPIIDVIETLYVQRDCFVEDLDPASLH